MPSNPTHRRVGPAAAAVGLAATSMPWWTWPLVLYVAEKTSDWPDHMEGPPRRARRWVLEHPLLLPLEPPLRYLQRHRWWTHSLAVELAIAGLIGWLIITALLLPLGLAVAAAHAHMSDPAPAALAQLCTWTGILVGLGAAAGMAAHTLLDTGTMMGSPVGWPFSKRRWRAPGPAIGERGERALRRLSPVVVAAAALAALVPWGTVA